tara:strand:+ start:174 stop:602 length:429 start_codon:yes stop_codon:yes gene_type:complete
MAKKKRYLHYTLQELRDIFDDLWTKSDNTFFAKQYMYYPTKEELYKEVYNYFRTARKFAINENVDISYLMEDEAIEFILYPDWDSQKYSYNDVDFWGEYKEIYRPPIAKKRMLSTEEYNELFNPVSDEKVKETFSRIYADVK